MRYWYFVFSFLILASYRPITGEDIQGDWATFEYNENIAFWRVSFKKDKIELTDNYTFKETGKYQIENGVLKIQLDRDNLLLETKFQHLDSSSFSIFENLTFSKVKHCDIEAYKLIGIPTNQILSVNEYFSNILHFYISEKNEIKIRTGEAMIDYDALSETLPLSIYSKKEYWNWSRRVSILIGEGITLKNLQKLYFHLGILNYTQVWLGTKKTGISDFHIFKDTIEHQWWEGIEKHPFWDSQTPPPPPTSLEFTSKKAFLEKGGTEIGITSKTDFEKIDKLSETERYLISIDSNLSIENYIDLKKRLQEKRKTNKHIRVEIE